MRISTGLLVACGVFFELAPIVGAPVSSAQCTITGPTQVCPGDSIELCAPPSENGAYLWQDPDGILYMTNCIYAFVPGLYTLRVLNQVTHTWSAPCSLMVQSGRAAEPTITGPATTCSGTPVEWCGPPGSYEYAWNGPNGFAATSACVSIADAGDYLLRVRALPAGCWGDSTVRTLAVTNCEPAGTNCPRPAWWWAQQCNTRDRRHGGLERTQIDLVARCVDDHAAAFRWSDDAGGFTRALVHERYTLRMRARRQFAAVWANVCAGQLAMLPRTGPAVTLDPATPIDAHLGGGTVAAWLAMADAELTRFELTSAQNRAEREAYRSLIRTGWHINHGLGIGRSCQTDLSADARMAVQDGMAASETNLEILDAELLDTGDGPLSLGAIEPNPFSTQATLAFAVSAEASGIVSISVFDVSGRFVRELARGSYAPGQYVVRWDGSADNGTRVRSGLYFIRGRVGDQQVRSRVTFIR